MHTIFDNENLHLLDELVTRIRTSESADFCVGYFNLRGWFEIGRHIDHYKGGEGSQARILIGMYRPPEEQLRMLFSAIEHGEELDLPTRKRLKTKMLQGLKQQLTIGVPHETAMNSINLLIAQLKAKKIAVKLFLRYPLHAKLYLIHRQDTKTPVIGYVGSSNLTMAGLRDQAELNLDVVDDETAKDLQDWFQRHWSERTSIDISDELIKILEESWVTPQMPYHIYLKMAYHLSLEARTGEKEFRLPKVLEERFSLLDFQKKAVSLAAYYIYRRGGVLLADVVGLGKTLMATAVAKIFEEDQGTNTLIICPANLVSMWEGYKTDFDLNADVISFDRAVTHLHDMRRFRFVIMDESHNLRNRDTKRYKAIHQYMTENEPYVILLTATPYNKNFLDLGSQLRMFVKEDSHLQIIPEKFFKKWKAETKTEADFRQKFQTAPDTLRAFEQSEFPDDWRDLMRLFLVRRTRSFVIQNYAKKDKGRYYLKMGNNKRFYFPVRRPKTLGFSVGTKKNDPYATLFTQNVVKTISKLNLARYGLKEYRRDNPDVKPTPEEAKVIKNLETAGTMLVGFVKSGLFKRLESCGFSFLTSIDRHILRNAVLVYALKNGLPIPIGAQDPALLDTAFNDRPDEDDFPHTDQCNADFSNRNWNWYLSKARDVYREMKSKQHKYSWIRPDFFKSGTQGTHNLQDALKSDSKKLIEIIFDEVPTWHTNDDRKLNALAKLLQTTHKNDKIIVFTQFADTANYLGCALKSMNLTDFEVVTGDHPNPTDAVKRFSPRSNNYDELVKNQNRQNQT